MIQGFDNNLASIQRIFVIQAHVMTKNNKFCIN